MSETEQATKKPHGSEKRERQAAIRLRVTAAEAAEIATRAERAGLTVGGYLRALAFGKDTEQPRAARRPPLEKAELVALRYELRKIGGNLNQLAHAVNLGNELDKAAFADVVADHSAVLDVILATLTGKPVKP